MDDQPLLTVNNLTTCFFRRDGVVKAVDGVSFELAAGETLGIVGESGSGKSVTALSLLRLVRPPGRIVGGEVLFDGTDLLKVDNARLRQIRGSDVGMIFQDPMSSLNPTLRIGRQVAEPRWWHGAGKREAFQHAVQLLTQVGIPTARSRARDYPFQFSGGMRQRTGIAAAVACTPRLLIADEPTTALDVTVQAQIINLLLDLQQELALSYLFISHNLAVVEQVSHRVAVMYLGVIVEEAPTEQLFTTPLHPYTQALLSAVPKMTTERQTRVILSGEIPSPSNPPTGCRFHPRCPYAMPICATEPPALTDQQAGHRVACHLYPNDGGDKRP